MGKLRLHRCRLTHSHCSTNHNLTLFFSDFEVGRDPDVSLVFAQNTFIQTIVLFVSVLLVQFLIQDGKSNYMEGMM